MASDEVKQAKADAKAEKARAKAMKPWYKKKRIIIPLLLIIVIAIAAAGSGTETSVDTDQTEEEIASNEPRFADRADIQESDLEILPSESATIEGMKITVDSTEYTKNASEFDEADEGETYLIATVTLVNESDETKPYNIFNYRVQTVSGQVLDHALTLLDNEIGSGDLVPGGTTTGVVAFEVPVEEGFQYIIWKPNAFDSTRVIVQVQQ